MQKKIRVGILFGGTSREREISFLGGRTAFENMDKRFFEPIPLFVDSLGNIIKINVELMYEASIRAFYPSRNLNKGFNVYIESLGELTENQLYKLIYKIGAQIKLEDLKNHIDFAFNVIHGPSGEDGSVQGLMEWLQIPYMGPGMLGSAIGIDKPAQNDLMAAALGQEKKYIKVSKEEWKNKEQTELFTEVIKAVGFPLVIKAPHQGSSIGVAIVKKRSVEEFQKAMRQCFFEQKILAKDWNKLSSRQKKNFVQKIANLDEGIGFPVAINSLVYYHPVDLITTLNLTLKEQDSVLLSAIHAEDHILIEEFIVGQEFSCGVIEDLNGKAVALPPAEVYGEIQTFDFKSKYQSNVSKKRIPVLTSDANLDKIHEAILKAYKATKMGVIARIDGFLTADDQVILHDPNTIPGMSPASFIFKQMAEIGFNISQSITYFIRQSIRERMRTGKNIFHLQALLNRLDQQIIAAKLNNSRKKVAIIFGENETEFAEAKAAFAKYSASIDLEPIPVCRAKNGNYYQIPVNLMFKPDIQEFGQSVGQPKHVFILKNIESTKEIRDFYIGQVDFSVKKLQEDEFSSVFDYSYACSTKTLV